METLRDYQQVALHKIRSCINRSFLLADEVGLGKTRVACAYAKDFLKVLIVAPLSTLGTWKSEAEIVGCDLSRITITNYEKLGKIPLKPWNLIIFDECHKLKSYKSKRHKLFWDLLPLTDKMLFLSATPAQNPLEMKYLCEIIGINPNAYWGWVKSFKGTFQPRWGGFKFSYGKPEDIKRLSGILNSPNSIRRTPDQIAGWPELNRIIHPVILNSTQMKEYRNAFKEYMDQCTEPITRKIRANNDLQRMLASGVFRQKMSELKVGATVELAKDFLEQGYVVTIACEFLDPLHRIMDAFHGNGCEAITGETNQASRDSVLKWSREDVLNVICFTVKEGINLHQMEDHHRPRIQINHDIRWSAMDMHQVQGRTHRAGKYAPNYWMVCKDTIDERIGRVLKEKTEGMASMLQHATIDSELFIYEKNLLTV